MVSDLFSSAGLAKRLFIRDKSAEYRQSVLGILWSLITPLINALVWIFLSSSGAVNISSSNIPYPLFVFIGTMLWGVLTESINMPLNVTQGAKSMISKVNFPKEAILLSGFYNLIFNTVIKLLIISIALIVFKINPGFAGIGIIPALLFLIVFGVSIGLCLTPIGLLYKDIGKAIPIGMSFLMYLSPVVYQEIKNPSLEKIIYWNPLTPIINGCRNLLTGFEVQQPCYLLGIFIFMILVFMVAWLFYRISIPIIVERM